ALVTALCNQHALPDDEEGLHANPELRQELARRYLDDLATLFFGMELNPFACYLAEMNMLIQCLDDLAVLREKGEMHPVERFQIYNTNSLLLPQEVLDGPTLLEVGERLEIPDRLSDRLLDEAYPIKAKLSNHAQGFFYVVSNPPYVTSKREPLDTTHFKETSFYASALSGDTNLYLLFIRLGLYYLAEYGQMIYIMPLTLFGDRSASAVRRLVRQKPFSPRALVRFYRGNVLFRGVDQAVGIIRVDHTSYESEVLIGEGATIQEVQETWATVEEKTALDTTSQGGLWQGEWLVTADPVSLTIWQKAKQMSGDLKWHLSLLLDKNFDRKQGDVNATHLNPLRIEKKAGAPTKGYVAIYKGETVQPFAPLPPQPSDWATPDPKKSQRVSAVLQEIIQSSGTERGIVLRQVARLNTRENLVATWFEREPHKPTAFTNELWRMTLFSQASETTGKALLALINSRTIAYLLNLFSTNNHVGKDELGRIPIPAPDTFPEARLADLADEVLTVRSEIERDFVARYRTVLPDFDQGQIYLPPSVVLLASSVPQLSAGNLVMQGVIKNHGPAHQKIKTLKNRSMIESIGTDRAFKELLQLFLDDPSVVNGTWIQFQNQALPEPRAAGSWLAQYEAIRDNAQKKWEHFVLLKKEIDEVVADWYGFDSIMREAINKGLPWARRSLPSSSSLTEQGLPPESQTDLKAVASSLINAIGYDEETEHLEIEFSDGALYLYKEVPGAIFRDFERADSKGKFFLEKIKDKYDRERL
ncbi:MAG: KTSC domain-containing protein, partial [Ardenticatenales bacterium]|nr:KTSC domain-containing protein [Ardenticatenales bacterium]